MVWFEKRYEGEGILKLKDEKELKVKIKILQDLTGQLSLSLEFQEIDMRNLLDLLWQNGLSYLKE